MERIVIEVSEETAKKWRLSSPEKRERISQRMNIRLNQELLKDSPDDFKKFLDEIGKTMEERGLTEKILQEILAEND
jgi:phosphotransacetylase